MGKIPRAPFAINKICVDMSHPEILSLRQRKLKISF